MRYVLIDRFLELEQGKHARAVKCVTRGEPFAADFETYPSPLVLEALLQAGGVLARASDGGGRMTVLGKVTRAEFPGAARPGDRIELAVEAVQLRPDGTMCEGVATVGDKVVGRAEFMIVFLPPELTPPADAEIVRRRRLLMESLRVPLEQA
jgi:3-hydroxyacyl-[acyl-carrier-protein] dehydratase